MKERILIVGSGGREHALGSKLAVVDRELIFAPGNPGTAPLGRSVDIAPDNISELVNFAKEEKVGLTVVGPELPLTLGITDHFESEGLSVFGPSQIAAKLESSKSWAAARMQRWGVPHPRTEAFQDEVKAIEYLDKRGWKNLVVKADGLAGGKGVTVPDSKKEAKKAIRDILVEKKFSPDGEPVLLQDRMTGVEVSVFAFCDGKTAVPMLPAQDYKRQKDKNKGPNTGGMGAFAPSPLVNADLMRQIQTEILDRTVDGMREDNIPYKGLLYAGLMLTDEGPKVVEYNVRFGDPEIQPLSMLFTGNLGFVMQACVKGTLHPDYVRHRAGATVCVVLASEGYPASSDKGTIITGVDQFDGDTKVSIFHAGTMMQDGKLVTNGGRILGITAYDGDLDAAAARAYQAAEQIQYKGKQNRTDIGKIYR